MQANDLIERVIRGEAAPKVVESIVSSSSPEAKVEVPGTSLQFSSREGRYLLAYLRPNDRFVFVGKSPSSSTRPYEEFVIVPAQRGFVAFSGRADAYTLELEKALQFQVELLSDPSTVSDRRFFVGDQIRHKMTGATGYIVSIIGNGHYSVRFGNNPSTVEMPEASLALINKDETTRSYLKRIKSSEGEVWVVRYGTYESQHSSQLDAVKTLRGNHRAAFNRWSKLVASDPSEELDLRVIKYLVRVDPRIWRSEKVLKSRGLFLDDQTLDQAVDALSDDRQQNGGHSGS